MQPRSQRSVVRLVALSCADSNIGVAVPVVVRPLGCLPRLQHSVESPPRGFLGGRCAVANHRTQGAGLQRVPMPAHGDPGLRVGCVPVGDARGAHQGQLRVRPLPADHQGSEHVAQQGVPSAPPGEEVQTEEGGVESAPLQIRAPEDGALPPQAPPLLQRGQLRESKQATLQPGGNIEGSLRLGNAGSYTASRQEAVYE